MSNVISDMYSKTKNWMTDVKDLFGGTTLEEIEIETTVRSYNPVLYKKISSKNVIYYILKTRAGGMVIYNKLTEDNVNELLLNLQKFVDK